MTNVLLTGAGGFIGAHVLEHLLENTTWDIVVTDSFRHKGKTDRITNVLDTTTGVCGPAEREARVRVITHDLTVPFSSQMIDNIGPVDYILALASESHVERSITDPVPFVRNNVDVALSTLEYARAAKPKALIYVSTDEVYGPIHRNDRGHEEWSSILPSNPYSASKAAQEAIAISYWRTYGVPLVIVNCMNLIGERQDAEKYLPTLIASVRDGKTVTVHGTEKEIGTRHYLHARNLADAMLYILNKLPPHPYSATSSMGRPDRYNIVGPDRVSNLELAQMVAKVVGNELLYTLVDFHSARPGHDAHYGLDGMKMQAYGWQLPLTLEESLRRTVEWSLKNPEWLK